MLTLPQAARLLTQDFSIRQALCYLREYTDVCYVGSVAAKWRDDLPGLVRHLLALGILTLRQVAQLRRILRLLYVLLETQVEVHDWDPSRWRLVLDPSLN